MRLTRVCCGYFKKYVEYEMRRKTGYDVRKPLYGWIRVGKKRWKYDQNHPITDQSFLTNISTKDKEASILIEPVKDWKIFRGDRVEILVGKDKGKQGIVNFIIKERNWCFVEGRHCRFEIDGKSSTSPGIMKREEMPLLVTNEVALVDPFDNASTEVEWRHQEDGQRVRVSLRTGRIVPIPDEANDYYEDFTKIAGYKPGDKDTSNDALKKVTYKPILKSFEQDIMDIMGIKEDKEPGKTYWY